MTIYNFTAEDLAQKVREIAAERPAFVYPIQGRSQCGYAGKDLLSTEGEGCIVGQAFQALGLGKDELVELERVAIKGLGAGIAYFLPLLEIEYTWKQMEWLKEVQRSQDTGSSWSVAVDNADREVRNRYENGEADDFRF